LVVDQRRGNGRLALIGLPNQRLNAFWAGRLRQELEIRPGSEETLDDARPQAVHQLVRARDVQVAAVALVLIIRVAGVRLVPVADVELVPLDGAVFPRHPIAPGVLKPRQQVPGQDVSVLPMQPKIGRHSALLLRRSAYRLVLRRTRSGKRRLPVSRSHLRTVLMGISPRLALA